VFELGTVSVVAVALFLIIFRYTGKMDSNLMIGAHMLTFEEGLSPGWVYVALVCALFLRFEFMNKMFVRLVRTVETIALSYVVYQCVGMIQAF
jgi:hypothetical protein